MKKTDFTFVIVTYRSENVIFDCLDALPNESYKIIIDNSNNLNLKNKLEEKYQNLKCYLMKDNIGYGNANNFGINKSSTEYIFILNPDVRLSNNKFDEILNILEKEEFTIAGPMETSEKLDFGNKKAIEVNEVKGFAMIFKKKDIINFLFDKNIFLYLEEIDLCKRIKKKNGRIIKINSTIDHLGGFSHGNRDDLEMEKSRNWHWMWSKFYYLNKHHGYFYALIRTLPNFFSSLLKFIFYYLLNRKNMCEKYKMRILGLYSSYLMKKSFYRPYSSKIY